jgi:hypothetical protein
MFPCFMVDFCNLDLLAPVEGKAGAGALQAKVGDRADVEFDGLLQARELLGGHFF